MITQYTIDKVFDVARVEEVIGEFVQLKKTGSNFKGLSPFTDEKTPSFVVSPVKQIWKDFSTGKGGNSVSFLMEHEHYTYPEAIKWLAKKYNIEIEETEQSDEQKQQLNERESMFLVSKFAKDYFHDLLLNSQAGRAIGLSYFKERGFREDIIQKFDLGYCKDEWDNFTKAALAKGYDLKYLKETGLTIVKEGGTQDKKFDRFKGRVMFPIHSMSGRILGFGGRILTNDKKAAKYLNSPESDIYHKSKILYGLYHAKKEIAKLDNCFLVEGYTDVISFHQSGVENVVASSGTALTPDQIRLINRLTKNITVLFDGDAAGIRASLRGIDLILEQGLNVRVVSFPEGEDPDSFAKAHSSAELKKHLEDKAQDFIEFKVSLLMEDAQNDPVKKAGLIRDIVTSISKIPDGIQREVYVQECARIMDISEQVLFSELAQLLQRGSTGTSSKSNLSRPNRVSASDDVNSTKGKGLEVLRAKGKGKQTHNIDQVSILEKEIIRILLLYGNEIVDFINWVDAHDKYGKPILEKEEYQSTVFNELYLNLQEDEIEFSNELFKLTYHALVNQLNQREKIVIDELIMHENMEVSGLVTNILMDEERYILSNWEKKEVRITAIEKLLPKLVTDAILNLRRVLIDKKIKGVMEDIRNEVIEVDLEEINNYNTLRNLLSEKLNRVV
ncbi:DNA primase [Tenacibaculum sp. MAR_2009_124]|uniref:DNA primase n=1 Tax=Tenacibaculum sp. MAR_2009_124 TaxID=1250059 RepID=UPI00089667C8|nr:DNA primase [Tenacibaculum sp. MAR_2009_124]SED14473.1 DNA primase [Tenacibaculum sp. MAR_2009_124]